MTRNQGIDPEKEMAFVRRGDRYEVDPKVMTEEITQQDMSEEERQRLENKRRHFLDQTQKFFADKMLEPTESYKQQTE